MSFLRLSAIGAITIGLALTSFGMKNASTSREGFSDREEINQSFDLSQGAQVKIGTINGTVTVETWDQAKAEIHIVKTTNRDSEDLKRTEVIIDHSSDRLDIHTRREENDHDSHVNVRVEVKLPRQMTLNLEGINGATDVGPVNGRVSASSINGRVKIAESTEELNISSINGAVTASLSTLGPNGIHADSINGSIDVTVPDDANLTVDVTDHNGGFNSELPFSMSGERIRNQVHGTIGSGGTPVKMDGINGGIHLRRRTAHAV